MSELSKAPLQCERWESSSVSGKVFLLGEYAVLSGLPALVAAVPPRFQLRVAGADSQVHSAGGVTSTPEITPSGSPLDRLNIWAAKMGWAPLKTEWIDPYQGAGGFGASTAQFALAYSAYVRRNSGEPLRWQSAWKLYRELMADSHPAQGSTSSQCEASILPSGADLVAQLQGGITFFDPSDGHCQDVWPLMDWSQLLVFSATRQEGRKVATHEHLSELSRRGFPHGMKNLLSDLEAILIQGISAVKENDAPEFGRALDAYAETLGAAALELPATRADRENLRSLNGVLGVKGAGAMQADAMIVLFRGSAADRQALIQKAQSRNLTLLCDGLTCEMGVAAS